MRGGPIWQLSGCHRGLYRSVAALVEADWWLLPPPIVGRFFLSLCLLV